MNDLIGSIAAGLYSALTGFALAAQALAGILPHQASLALSALLACVAFWAGRISAGKLRAK